MRRCAQCQVDYPDALEFCPTDGAKLPPIPGDTQALYDPLVGSTIDGRYLVESVLGEGGMGMVYACRHAIIDKRVAIKVLRKEAAVDESAAQRFLAEAKAASKIGQQNIVDITDFGVLSDGHAYFVMEFLDGPTLGKVMSKKGPLAPARVATIAQQVCRGLAAAHGKGIVHRDLKPENIFVLERDGMVDFVKIVDFGIARDIGQKKRLTVAGMVMGTPEYMAPEQASGQEIDHRSDQYALGCILYESLTGQVPFRGDNAMQTLTKHVFDALTPPSRMRRDLNIPAPLEAVVLRTLAKQREERYADMDAMYAALEEILPALRGIEVPASARKPSSTGLASDSEMLSSVTRRPRALTLGALGVVVLAAAGFFLMPHGHTHPAITVVPAPATPVAAPTPPPPLPSTPRQAETSPEASVELVLSSVPPNSQVFLDDELLGTTPITVKRPRAPNGKVTLIFRKSGYKDTEHVVSVAGNGYVTAALPREIVASKKAPAAHASSQGSTGSSSLPPANASANTKKTSEQPNRHNSELRDPF